MGSLLRSADGAVRIRLRTQGEAANNRSACASSDMDGDPPRLLLAFCLTPPTTSTTLRPQRPSAPPFGNDILELAPFTCFSSRSLPLF